MEAPLSSIVPRTCISVKNVYVNANIGLDVWGRRKVQPALISARVQLTQPFQTAALDDSVDRSTLHYGDLAKTIRDEIVRFSEARWQDLPDVAVQVWIIASLIGINGTVSSVDVTISLPKASMLGDSIEYQAVLLSHSGRHTLHLKNIRAAALIGVNSNEREAKQRVIANLWFSRDDAVPQVVTNHYPEIEKYLVNVSGLVSGVLVKADF